MVCTEVHQKVVDHWFDFWQNETIQEECPNWKKSLRYLGMVKDQYSQMDKTLGTRN